MTLSWRLSLITFILVPIIFVASKIFGSYYDILSERTQNAVADSNDVAEEVLSTMRTVRSFACEEVEGDRFYMKLTKTLNVTKTKAIAYVGFLWVSEVFEYIDRVPTILHYGTAQPSVLNGRIEFRNVHFSYPTRSNIPILRVSSVSAVVLCLLMFEA
ncbi:hypothetical protein TELCIR_20783 [Teladorsagia circumcincta]|uniref:ABC transmembrane type-1 domain-containing protein n=1 Tax=Teladorsagia circumcincta TaxID=45464 RepID=A0A2G9TIK8_TELCI|nr:hypothetical protein TELCIR_20783 [Teladorsagia circumcincta]